MVRLHRLTANKLPLEASRSAFGDPDRLLADLRTQILPLDATPLQSNKFGQYYEIRGRLKGPHGRVLGIRSIWMTEHLSKITKFVTLIPDKSE